jgi:type II secretory pathway pseudopilin PulG
MKTCVRSVHGRRRGIARCAAARGCAHARVRKPQRGFTYLGLLFLVAVIGVGLAAGGLVWHTAVQREREHELLFAGEQYRRAIKSYYDASPGAKQYPRSLDDLLLDPRFPNVRRHLRRIYPDPMTGGKDWEPVSAPDGAILGVHSRSKAKPLKSAGFKPELAAFAQAQSYAGWVFAFIPEQGEPRPPGAARAVPAPRDGPAPGGDAAGVTMEDSAVDGGIPVAPR